MLDTYYDHLLWHGVNFNRYFINSSLANSGKESMVNAAPSSLVAAHWRSFIGHSPASIRMLNCKASVKHTLILHQASKMPLLAAVHAQYMHSNCLIIRPFVWQEIGPNGEVTSPLANGRYKHVYHYMHVAA